LVRAAVRFEHHADQNKSRLLQVVGTLQIFDDGARQLAGSRVNGYDEIKRGTAVLPPSPPIEKLLRRSRKNRSSLR
jgi:hypothetical protein